MRTSKRRIIWASIISGLILLVCAGLTSYRFRISILHYISRPANYCSTISNSGKWLLCFDPKDRADGISAVYVYSTDLPFRKIKILLPKPLTQGDNMAFSRIETIRWSIENDSFALPIWKSPGEPSAEMYIVRMLNEGSYVVNRFFGENGQVGGVPFWSTVGSLILYAQRNENGTFRMSLLDNNARLIDQFETQKILNPHKDEEVARADFMWDGDQIFAAVYYRAIIIKGEPVPIISRTEIYRGRVADSGTFALLIDEPEKYSLFSIDPNKKSLLLIEDDDLGRGSNKAQLINTASGEIVEEIDLNPTNKRQNISGLGNCLVNCEKSFVEMGVGDDRFAKTLVWTWSTKQFKTYPNNSTVYGSINSLNGFLCVNDTFTKYPFVAYDVCK